MGVKVGNLPGSSLGRDTGSLKSRFVKLVADVRQQHTKVSDAEALGSILFFLLINLGSVLLNVYYPSGQNIMLQSRIRIFVYVVLIHDLLFWVLFLMELFCDHQSHSALTTAASPGFITKRCFRQRLLSTQLFHSENIAYPIRLIIVSIVAIMIIDTNDTTLTIQIIFFALVFPMSILTYLVWIVKFLHFGCFTYSHGLLNRIKPTFEICFLCISSFDFLSSVLGMRFVNVNYTEVGISSPFRKLNEYISIPLKLMGLMVLLFSSNFVRTETRLVYFCSLTINITIHIISSFGILNPFIFFSVVVFSQPLLILLYRSFETYREIANSVLPSGKLFRSRDVLRQVILCDLAVTQGKMKPENCLIKFQSLAIKFSHTINLDVSINDPLGCEYDFAPTKDQDLKKTDPASPETYSSAARWRKIVDMYLENAWNTWTGYDLDILHIQWLVQRNLNLRKLFKVLSIIKKKGNRLQASIVYQQACNIVEESFQKFCLVSRYQAEDKDTESAKSIKDEENFTFRATLVKEVLNLNAPLIYETCLITFRDKLKKCSEANRKMLNYISNVIIHTTRLYRLLSVMKSARDDAKQYFHRIDRMAHEMCIKHLNMYFLFNISIAIGIEDSKKFPEKINTVITEIRLNGQRISNKFDSKAFHLDSSIIQISLNKNNFGRIINLFGDSTCFSKSSSALIDQPHTAVIPNFYAKVHSIEAVEEAWMEARTNILSNKVSGSFFLNIDTKLITSCLVTKRIQACAISQGIHCLVAIKPLSTKHRQIIIVNNETLEIESYTQNFLDLLPLRFLNPQPVAKLSRNISDRIHTIDTLQCGSNLHEHEDPNPQAEANKKSTLPIVVSQMDLHAFPSDKPTYFRFDDRLQFYDRGNPSNIRELKFRVEIYRRKIKFLNIKKDLSLIRLKFIEDLTAFSIPMNIRKKKVEDIKALRRRMVITVKGEADDKSTDSNPKHLIPNNQSSLIGSQN